MAWTQPTVAEFKTYFARDFNFAPVNDPDNIDLYIVDADVTKAINEALINFNTELYGTDDQITSAFMYLAAFHMVVNLQNSSKGIASQSKFPISSNSVGGVSVNYLIPERYSRDPYLSQFVQNGYGMKYLAITIPFLVGAMEFLEGTTTSN